MSASTNTQAEAHSTKHISFFSKVVFFFFTHLVVSIILIYSSCLKKKKKKILIFMKAEPQEIATTRLLNALQYLISIFVVCK